MRNAASAFVTVAIALTASSVQAGPWATGRGHFYSKLSYGYLRSTTLAAPDGTLFDIPRFTKHEAGLYGTYGLTDRFTAIANIPILRSSRLRDFGTESGLGDVQFGLQAQLGGRGPWVFAVRGMAQAPTGDETRARGILPTGSGVWEGEAVVGAGRSLAGGKGYGFAEVGHQFRGGELRDGLVYAVQVGWNATKRLVLAANLRGVEPYSKAPRDVAIGSPVGVSDRVTYIVYGPTAIFALGEGAGLQVDVDGAFHARNLAKGVTFRVGLFVAR